MFFQKMASPEKCGVEKLFHKLQNIQYGDEPDLHNWITICWTEILSKNQGIGLADHFRIGYL